MADRFESRFTKWDDPKVKKEGMFINSTIRSVYISNALFGNAKKLLSSVLVRHASVGLVGILEDGNSSFCTGPRKAPPLIRLSYIRSFYPQCTWSFLHFPYPIYKTVNYSKVMQITPIASWALI